MGITNIGRTGGELNQGSFREAEWDSEEVRSTTATLSVTLLIIRTTRGSTTGRSRSHGLEREVSRTLKIREAAMTAARETSREEVVVTGRTDGKWKPRSPQVSVSESSGVGSTAATRDGATRVIGVARRSTEMWRVRRGRKGGGMPRRDTGIGPTISSRNVNIPQRPPTRTRGGGTMKFATLLTPPVTTLGAMRATLVTRRQRRRQCS